MPWKLTILFSLISLFVLSQETSVLFYNVENLFDTEKDSVKNDIEFTPKGSKNWTKNLYKHKINQLAKVILSSSNKLPDVIGLAEIENSNVLEDLINHPLLRKAKYEFIQFESSDPRGIDVALLFQPKKFNLIKTFPFKTLNNTRDILYAQGITESKDTLNLFINHWPSRRNGKKKSEQKRVKVANHLVHLIDSLSMNTKSFNTIVLGDFNDETTDKSLQTLQKKLNLSATLNSDTTGTLVYKNHWYLFDNFFVSQNIRFTCSVIKYDWMLEEGKRTKKPKRSFKGNFYNKGFSDHLPILLQMSFN